MNSAEPGASWRKVGGRLVFGLRGGIRASRDHLEKIFGGRRVGGMVLEERADALSEGGITIETLSERPGEPIRQALEVLVQCLADDLAFADVAPIGLFAELLKLVFFEEVGSLAKAQAGFLGGTRRRRVLGHEG